MAATQDDWDEFYSPSGRTAASHLLGSIATLAVSLSVIFIIWFACELVRARQEWDKVTPEFLESISEQSKEWNRSILEQTKAELHASLQQLEPSARLQRLRELSSDLMFKDIIVDELLEFIRKPQSLTVEQALDTIGSMGSAATVANRPIEEMLKKLRAGEFDAELDKGKIVEPTQFPVAVSLDSAEVKKRIESAAQSALQRIKGNASP